MRIRLRNTGLDAELWDRESCDIIGPAQGPSGSFHLTSSLFGGLLSLVYLGGRVSWEDV